MAKNEERLQAAEQSSVPVKKAKKNTKPGFFKRVAKWFREMKSELKKVVWPTPKQITNNTAVALVVMAASAVVLWAFDSLADAGIHALISLVG